MIRDAIKKIALGLIMGAIISAALFLPTISVEQAIPSGFNMYFGELGYHVSLGDK
jgi:ABC-type spermidine/putrescine transport system permease subunit II